MPVYAATSPVTDHRLHPKTLLLIVGGHAVLLAAVMSAKMDLPTKIVSTVTEVELIETVEPPPPPEPQPMQDPRPLESQIERITPIVPVPLPDPIQSDPQPIPLPIPSPADIIGPSIEPTPPSRPVPAADPVRVGPRFVTPASQVRPPYPPSKLEREEEAALRLRLSIDARGRVTAVEPVGSTDRVFLQAARRHLIANWRYTPATEDGRPVPSTTVITLRFELNG